MEDIVRAALAGIAIGGFAAAVVGANQIVLQSLWQFNCLAAETAWVMAKAPLERMIRTRQEQQRRRQWLQRMAAAQTENEDENDGDDES